MAPRRIGKYNQKTFNCKAKGLGRGSSRARKLILPKTNV